MCAETSGLWTTAASPAGHQVTEYTQALASDMLAITAACSGFEGVAPGYLSELAGSSTGSRNVRIATGGAMVDGKYYKNTANVDKTLDLPSGGTTRIDRVVLEALWSTTFTCVVTVIKGTESGGTPTPPSITQTSGTKYDILLYQALINASGDVTLTDERTWAIVDTDESTLEDAAGLLRVKDLGITAAKLATDAVTTGKIINDAVDDTKAGNRVPQFYRRQGGSATEWATQGTTDYTPTSVRMQAGSVSVSGNGTVAITFPVAFSYTPLVFVTNIHDDAHQGFQVKSTGYTAAGFTILNTSSVGQVCFWLAIGPE
jgi:hypothetical protein